MSTGFTVLQRIAAPLKEDPAYTPANYKKVAESSQAMRGCVP